MVRGPQEPGATWAGRTECRLPGVQPEVLLWLPGRVPQWKVRDQGRAWAGTEGPAGPCLPPCLSSPAPPPAPPCEPTVVQLRVIPSLTAEREGSPRGSPVAALPSLPHMRPRELGAERPGQSSVSGL